MATPYDPWQQSGLMNQGLFGAAQSQQDYLAMQRLRQMENEVFRSKQAAGMAQIAPDKQPINPEPDKALLLLGDEE